MNLNQVTLLGRLTKDPELKYTTSGTAVTSFSLAINEHYKNKEAKKVESTVFVECEAWRKLAENIADYMKKGSPLLVCGKLKLDKWDDKEGKHHSKLKVVANTARFISSSKPGEKVKDRTEPQGEKVKDHTEPQPEDENQEDAIPLDENIPY